MAIFVSGFHANTDPIMLFFIVASAFVMESRRNLVGCGLLLGVAMEVKIIPVDLVPAILLMLPTYRRRGGSGAGASTSLSARGKGND